ncbi:GntR family transcriptional regulator [Anaerosphaera multitolerans]|uniref:GntR family transcriptional regulator n=1 Tax=Anaerosphaera multitolerans TaxID=2487351 RepID=A0A437S6N0_9FIRM|nr:GntR family transcriptional regulator [Anaerosphaera multitolerans]RVU54662.1 GntR family transcriptional regulator [Anaerosphaera multitolerans]
MEKINIKQPKDYITENIIEEIILGNIEDGDELVQEDIARVVGLSRMPVRESLQILEWTGFAKKLPNRRVVAVAPTKKNIKSTFRTLAFIEYSIIIQIIEENKLSDLEKIMAEYIKSPSRRKEVEIHRYISEILGVYPICNIHNQLLSGYFNYAVNNRERGVDSIKEQIIEIKKSFYGEKESILSALNDYFKSLSEDMIEVGEYD